MSGKALCICFLGKAGPLEGSRERRRRLPLRDGVMLLGAGREERKEWASLAFTKTKAGQS